MKQEEKTCINCNFWEQMASDASRGFCRRLPPAPRIEPAGGQGYEVVWPQTLANAWCGDFTVRRGTGKIRVVDIGGR